MDIERLGEILALLGLAVVLVSSLGRRRVRDSKVMPTGAFGLWVRYGDFVGFGLLLAGLVLLGVARK